MNIKLLEYELIDRLHWRSFFSKYCLIQLYYPLLCANHFNCSHSSLNALITPFACFPFYCHLNAIQFCSITIVTQLSIDDILPTMIAVISDDIFIEGKYWFSIHYPIYDCLPLWLTYKPLCAGTRRSPCASAQTCLLTCDNNPMPATIGTTQKEIVLANFPPLAHIFAILCSHQMSINFDNNNI